MATIAAMPVRPEDFGRRDQEGLAQWNSLSQELTRRSMEVDSLNATVNGLHRMLTDGPQQGVARDPASTQRFQAELDANARDLKRYREALMDLRRDVDKGRSQIGLGDARYQNDALARDEFRDLLDREVRLAGTGVAGGGPQRFAALSSPLLSQLRDTEAQLVASVQAIEAQVAARSGELQGKVDAERLKLANYQQQLDALDNDGRDLVGHVAQRNFGIVRDRMRGIVLRADVGITEQAWEVREEELDRVRSLQSERARQEQLLDEELKEVRDDGVERTQPSN
jgi:chromosome segregation ATPase